MTKWIKGTETISGSGRTLANFYQKCTLDHTSSTTIAYTENFNWVIDGDFTIMFNIDADNHNSVTWTIAVQGSGDGTNYAELQSFASVASDTAVKMMVYDYDTYGRCPYMRLACTPTGTVGGDVILIGIINH